MIFINPFRDFLHITLILFTTVMAKTVIRTLPKINITENPDNDTITVTLAMLEENETKNGEL